MTKLFRIATKPFALTVLAFCFAISADAQIINVKGMVIDSSTQKPLFKTTVVRLSDNSVFFTDSLGQFDLTCTRNDAVRFSFVGYKTLRLVIINTPDSIAGYKKYLRIEMPIDKHALQQIVVKGEKPEKEDSIYYAKTLKPIDVENVLESPITAIYAEFSKKEKEKKELQQILQAHYIDELYRYRFPKSRLLAITGDKSFTVEMLQRQCPLSEFYLSNATDYELLNYAKSCYVRHKNDY